MEGFKKITENNFGEFVEKNCREWLSDRVYTFLMGNICDAECNLQHR